MNAEELIKRVMTEHWDIFACWCKFCRVARELGFRPTEDYPTHPKVSILKCIDNGVGYEGENVSH